MGWVWYMATHYKNGSVDRKAEMDSLFDDRYTVLKSSMVGRVYYAAIKHDDEVFGFVGLTATDMRQVYNFGYKDMDETMGPGYNDCPKGILDLLTPTDNVAANEWRAACAKHRAAQNTKSTRLRNLPVGTEIVFENYKGETVSYYKLNIPSVFKKPFWGRGGDDGKIHYIPANQIPDDFRVVEDRTR